MNNNIDRSGSNNRLDSFVEFCQIFKMIKICESELPVTNTKQTIKVLKIKKESSEQQAIKKPHTPSRNRHRKNRFEKPAKLTNKAQYENTDTKDNNNSMSEIQQTNDSKNIHKTRNKRRKFEHAVIQSQKLCHNTLQMKQEKKNNDGFVPIEQLLTNLTIKKQIDLNRYDEKNQQKIEETFIKQQQIQQQLQSPHRKMLPKGSKYCTSQYIEQQKSSIIETQNKSNYFHHQSSNIDKIDHFLDYHNTNDPFDLWFKDKLSNMKQWKQKKLNNTLQNSQINTTPIKSSRKFYLPNDSKSITPNKKTKNQLTKTMKVVNKQNIQY